MTEHYYPGSHSSDDWFDDIDYLKGCLPGIWFSYHDQGSGVGDAADNSDDLWYECIYPYENEVEVEYD